jgi:heme-degrading monooxygenase HmoA
MFSRNVSIRLKPNMLKDFAQVFDKDIVPMLRKQPGFRDEIALTNESGTHVTAISLWDSKEQAEVYDKAEYPKVLKGLEKFLDGAPKVHMGTVINSTLHKLTAVAAA